MEYFITAIITIIIWQIFVFIVYFVTTDDTVSSVLGMLIPFCVVMGILNFCEKLYLSWCKKHLNLYRIFYRENGEIIEDAVFYASNECAEKFTQDDKSDYFIRIIINGKDFKFSPPKSSIYRGEEYFAGWEMDKFLKKTGE